MLNYVDQPDSTSVNDEVEKNVMLSDLPKDILNKVESNGFDLIAVNNFSGKIEYISESVRRVLGFSKAQLIGKSVFRYIMRDDQKYVRKFFDINHSGEQKFYIHIRNQIGRFIVFETILQVIYWNGEKKILSLSKDISDKKQAEEMLIRSEKMSIAGQLAAGIAHEIRNPLTSLKGFVQLLQGGINSKDEYYKIMMDEIDKINTITSELLFISKPMTDEKNDENINKMLHDVLTLLKTQANLFDIDLVLEADDEDCMVYCDRSQIKQVFINLIKNAIEEMTDGGMIHVLIKNNTEECIIAIKDQGPGIPKHLIHKLKEPFFTTKKNGTGLGLMISNQIIDNHSGKLEIESENGQGSTFSIYLPFNGK
ncbi:two-component system, sporulation sensor kinase A [Gracilibacillus orientalis]|uniref:histidine kinase n=1 Tax=Gracilibacillus orientalis TaxID=334253 RepID=A0A1I4Q9Y9_9BACI|nr:ATP-binding protein [Gracilibacillus orientalis]SFM36867.1 two-component system, sporulation sensor kinase A [Gracilibacillus orientalis]